MERHLIDHSNPGILLLSNGKAVRSVIKKNGTPWGFHFFYRLKILAPNSMVITKSARNIKNSTLAIEAAPSAIPPNPKIAAIIATTKKITDQRSIT